MRTAAHWAKHRLGLEPARSQTSEAERAILSLYASRAKRLLEIGVYEGLTTAILAKAMPEDAVLYGVDPFFKGRIGFSWGKLIAKREIRRVGVTRVELVEDFSVGASQKLTGDFDFIFID